MKSLKRSKTYPIDPSYKKKKDRKEKFHNEKENKSYDDNSENYLIDTNVLYDMYYDSSACEKLKKHSNKKKINLHIIEQIKDEFKFLIVNKLPEKYDEFQDDQKKNKFKKTLKKLGKFNYIESPRNSKDWIWADNFRKTKGKEYKNYHGQGLSIEDCLLYRYYLINSNYELITNDKQLKIAAGEIKEKFRPKMIFDPLL